MKQKQIATTILTTTILANLLSPKAEAHNLAEDITETEFHAKDEKTKESTNILIEQAKNIKPTNTLYYIESPNTLKEMVYKLSHQITTQKMYDYGYLKTAPDTEIGKRLLVKPRINSKVLRYQFLRLDVYRSVNAVKLEEYLEDKGIFKGHAIDFIEAAKENNIDPIYLVSHAMLETGNGTSTLAKGTKINQTTYYNFFGINAFDASPLYGGVSLAQKEDWSSVSKAIRGGAKWISRNYINSPKHKQRTLYEMRFSPLAKDPWHIYATDIEWADKISRIMFINSKIYNSGNQYNFEAIEYK